MVAAKVFVFERPAFRRPDRACYDDVWLFRQCCLVPLWKIFELSRHHQDTRSYLKEQAQGRDIVIDAVTDPYDINFAYSKIKEQNIDDIVTVLVQDRADSNGQNFRWFPVWILKAINQHRVIDYAVPPDLWHSRSRHLSCLNRVPKHHRFLTLYLLSQQSWFDQVYLSFGGYDPLNQGLDQSAEMADFFTAEECAWFQARRAEWPIKHDSSYQWCDVLGQHDPYTPAYSECYANLTTETEMDTFCVTEKTTKNLRTGCVFFAVAPQHHMSRVRSWGFDINYVGIDLTYDSIKDWRERTHSVVQEVNRVYHELPDIWHTNLDRLKYNSELFHSDEFARTLLTDVEDLICL